MTACSMVLGFSLISKLAVTLVLATIPVRVTTSSGEAYTAELRGLTNSTVLLSRPSEGRTELHFDDAISLEHVDAPEKTPPTSLVTLHGGTTITAQDLSLDGETLVVEPRRQREIRVNVKQVKSIRFRPSSPETDAKWFGLLEQEGRGDVLAIRNTGAKIDPYRGIVEGIADGVVKFNLDSDIIDAPMDRLEGIVFASGSTSASEPLLKIKDIYGSTWLVSKVLPGDDVDPLRIQLSGPTVHELPVSHVLSIQWSSGIQSLAAIEPAEASHETFFKTKVDPKLVSQWFGPAAEGESDLVLQGDSFVEYRVEKGFNSLVGSVTRASQVKDAGNAKVRISIDGNVEWEQEVGRAEPLGFQLQVTEARRVRIEVDSGPDGDLGDTIRITRARFVK